MFCTLGLWARKSLLGLVLAFGLLQAGYGLAQQPPGDPAAAASDIADIFSHIGDQIFEDCIFELSQEQLEVQQELIAAYVKHGASSSLARQLAVKQIEPPKPSDRCERTKSAKRGLPPSAVAPVKPKIVALPKIVPGKPASTAPLADKKVLSQWDCGPGVDYVTIQHKGYERKLTGGEICNPFDDIVRNVPDTIKTFRLGYTIRTGRLFVDEPQTGGRTIAWAISGRDVCRNNPDPDCLAARAIGPLPPGEYSFSSDKESRVSWGPRTKRMVAGIYLTKLSNREQFSPAQTAAILARGNIAIHVRLKGEMSEACLGLGPNGWAYVASLIKDGRATGVTAYIDEPYPQIAEAPPVMKASSFSLSSLFK